MDTRAILRARVLEAFDAQLASAMGQIATGAAFVRMLLSAQDEDGVPALSHLQAAIDAVKARLVSRRDALVDSMLADIGKRIAAQQVTDADPLILRESGEAVSVQLMQALPEVFLECLLPETPEPIIGKIVEYALLPFRQKS